MAHEALQSNGSIAFVYARENTYPFAYVRSSGAEKILVVLNPSMEPAAFPGAYAPKETLYRLGGEAAFSADTVTVPANSAGFYLL